MIPAARRLLVAVAAALALAGCEVPRRLVYPAPWPPRTPVLEGGAVVRVPMAEGAPDAVGFWAPGPENEPVVVLFHGNGMQLADVVPLVAKLRDDRLGVLAVELPGYGLAGGAPSEAGIYAASEALLADLRETKGVAPDRTVLVGLSIGTGIAAEMALRGRGRKLVLVSPFTSLHAVGYRLAPFMTEGTYTEKYETVRKAPRIDMPVLLVHGTEDKLIPAASSITLAAQFPCAVPLWVVGAGHNDVFAGRRGEAVIAEIAVFAHLPPSACDAQK